jgi:iron complex outermembrane receptor protein
MLLQNLNGSVRAATGAALAMSLLNLAAAAVSAQTTADSTSDLATDPPGERALEEIVVTAQKREQNLQDVPISVSVVSGAALASANITNAADLARVVPALNIFTTSGAVQPFLRGIGNPGSLQGNESSVAVYLDDVYLSRVPPSLLELNSIERVEVLKGPQGTLFGRNASGGLLHIVTAEPSEDTVVRGSLGYGNFETYRGTLYASTGLAPGIAVDVSALIEDQQGWGRNVATGQEWGQDNTKAVRGKLRWEASSGTTVSLSADYSRSRNDFLATSQYQYGIQRGYSRPPYGLQPRLGFYDIEADSHPLNIEEAWGVALRVELELPFATFASISAYRRDDNFAVFESDFTRQSDLRADLSGFSKQFSQEFQLSSQPASTLEWIAGLYYLSSEAGYRPSRFTGESINALSPLFGLPAGTAFVADTYGVNKDESYAGYGQATYHITDTTGLTLGARYTKDDLTGEGRSDLYPLGGTPFTASSISASKSFSKFTYKASIDQQLTSDMLVYVSRSRGYKAGLFNTLPVSNPPAKPEVLDSTELGFKSELLDRRLRLNGAAFYYSFHDAQFQQFDGPTVVVINAKSARIYGSELEGQAVLTPGLEFRFGAGYLHSEYTNFTNTQTPVPNTNTNPAIGPVGGYVNGFAPFDATGNDMVRVPKWTANAGLNYELETALGIFDFDVNYAYTDAFAWDADNILRQPAYSLVDGQVKYSFPGAANRFSIRLWAKNITKTKYYVAQIESDGARGSSAMPGAPQTYGIDWLFDF